MLISGRQAAGVLAEAGLARRQVRALLASGLAGAPTVGGGAHLYEAEAVRELASRPCLSGADVVGAWPGLLFVARRRLDVLESRVEQLEQVSRCWDIGVRGTNVVLQTHLHARGPVPLVATVCGFVALGAEIQQMVGEAGGKTYRMMLGEPGPWFSAFERKRLLYGPGRDFVLVNW